MVDVCFTLVLLRYVFGLLYFWCGELDLFEPSGVIK